MTPPSSVDSSSLSRYLATVAPYNVGVVCRTWRTVVQMNAVLWSSFYFSLAEPTDHSHRFVTLLVKKHVALSKNALLTGSIEVKGKSEPSQWADLLDSLRREQHRWRSISLKFGTFSVPRNKRNIRYGRPPLMTAVSNPGTPVNANLPTYRFTSSRPIAGYKYYLDIEAMSSLEEFRVSHSGEYIFGRSVAVALPSLTCLSLRMKASPTELLRWLALAPNVKQVAIWVYDEYPINNANICQRAEDGDIPSKINHVLLSSLQHLLVDCDTTSRFVEAAAFVLPYITTPALVSLDTKLASVRCTKAFHDFIVRSSPARIGTCRLVVYISGATTERFRAALELLPTVRKLAISWIGSYRPTHNTSILRLLTARRQSPHPIRKKNTDFVLFPDLKILEIFDVSDEVSTFRSLISARSPYLERVVLADCAFVRRYGFDDDGYDSRDELYDRETVTKLQAFHLGSDLKLLPWELGFLKPIIAGGLKFEIKTSSGGMRSSRKMVMTW